MNLKGWVLTLLGLMLLVFGLSFLLVDGYPTSQKENILVEAHGLLFDVIIFGILFVVFAGIREKNMINRQHSELIDDYRNWVSEEATHRIAGAIRRLANAGYKSINASSCFLRKASFRDIKINGADFRRANLRGASFRGCSIRNVNFYGADCREVDFSDCELTGVIFGSVDLRGAIGLDATSLAAVKSAEGARFGPDKEARLRREIPNIFEVPISREDSGLPLVVVNTNEKSGTVEIRIDE